MNDLFTSVYTYYSIIIFKKIYIYFYYLNEKHEFWSYKKS